MYAGAVQEIALQETVMSCAGASCTQFGQAIAEAAKMGA